MHPTSKRWRSSWVSSPSRSPSSRAARWRLTDGGLYILGTSPQEQERLTRLNEVFGTRSRGRRASSLSPANESDLHEDPLAVQKLGHGVPEEHLYDGVDQRTVQRPGPGHEQMLVHPSLDRARALRRREIEREELLR